MALETSAPRWTRECREFRKAVARHGRRARAYRDVFTACLPELSGLPRLPLAQRILRGDFAPGDTVRVGASEGVLTFAGQAEAAPVEPPAKRRKA